MKHHSIFRFLRLLSSRVLAAGLHFAPAAAFLLFFITPLAYGQMGMTTTYSDTWHDGSGINMNRTYNEGDPVPGSYVIGAGVTGDSYNSYGHECWARTTLTGATGATASAEANYGGSYACAEARLEFHFTEDETGYYSTESEHGYFCPIAHNSFSFGGTFNLVIIGLSVGCYRKYDSDVFFDYYRIVPDCRVENGRRKVTCAPDTYLFPGLGNTEFQTRQETWLSGDNGQTRFCTGTWVPLNNIFRNCTKDSCRDFPARS